MDTSLFEFVFLPFLLAFFFTGFITPVIIRLTKKYNLIDDPNRKHPAILHTKPVPRGGGIALFLGTFLAAVFLLPWNALTTAVFFSAFLALIIGVIDDRLNAQSKDVPPYFRLIVNLLCAIIVVGSGISVPFITHPLSGVWHFDTIRIPLFFGQFILLSHIVAIVWIIWVMNMLNWSKGVDGVMPGSVVIAAVVIGMLSLRFSPDQPTVAIDIKLSFIIAGSALAFLFFNFSPAKIFPGYGATSFYLLLAVVSILSGAKLATAILVLGVPTIDALFTIFRRLFSRQSIFKGDKKHLHHILLQLGWTHRQIALFYWIISGILGGVALQLQSRSKVFAILMLLVLVGGGLYFLHSIIQSKNEKNVS